MGTYGVHITDTPLATQYAAAQHAQKKRMLATSSGVALAMKMDVEERVLARFRRGPGLVSSMAGLETALGLDTDVDFGDYLNDPEFRTHEVDVHVAMEKRQDTEALVAAGRRQ